MSLRYSPGWPPPRASDGFTLIELMVGVAISLVIVLAVAAMYITTANIGRSNLRVAEIQSSGQIAMDALRRDLINAGFRGLTGDPAQLNRAAANVVSNDCAEGFSMNLRQAVWAANDSNPFSASCIPTASYLIRDELENGVTVNRGRDVLAIRRLGIAPTGTLQSGRLYFRSAFQTGQYFAGSTVPTTFTFTPAENYAADAVVYFISPFTVSANESPPVPALYRVRLVPGPAMSAPELVASGIEDMQVQFDVRDGDDVRVLDPGAAPLAAATAADSATDGPTGWEDVVAVRVFLLVRAQAGEVGFTPGSRDYQLGSRTVTFNDNIPRQVLSSVFSLRNR